MDNQTIKNKSHDSNTETPKYDPHIVPAETGARQDREGDRFMTTPSQERDQQALTDNQTDSESIDTTGGYRIDREGLIDNFAVEPEMYINEPGDLREREAELAAKRHEDIANFNQDEQGKLTMEQDSRGRGPGLI